MDATIHSTEFMRPRYVGIRFEGHAIPLELFSDLAVLKDLVTDVAKAKYLQDNPDRKRIPKGFAKGLELKIDAIEEGSAVPVIKLVIGANLLFPPADPNCFESARDAIIEGIHIAESDPSRIKDYIPEKSLAYFDRFGRSLRDGESIEFSRGDASIATLTQNTRKALVRASKVQDYTEEITIRGIVPEADQEKMTFELQPWNERQRVKAKLEPQHLETVTEAFAGYTEGIRVFIEGIGRFNRQNRLLEIIEIHSINTLNALDISARLEELGILQPGWLDGIGVPPSAEGLQWLDDQFAQHYPDDVFLPYLYPTEEGGIRAEWSQHEWECSLDIDIHTHQALWHAFNLSNEKDEECELDLSRRDAWGDLVAMVKEKVGGVV